MAFDPMERLREARSQTADGGLSRLMVSLVGGTAMTIAFVVWRGLESLGDAFMAPFQALATSLATLISGSIGGPVLMLDAAVQTGVESVTTGMWSTFGIFAYPITMVAVMLGIIIFARMWDRVDLSPMGWLRSIRR